MFFFFKLNGKIRTLYFKYFHFNYQTSFARKNKKKYINKKKIIENR